MRNIEYKAELRDAALARSVCRAIGATWVGELEQTDTYYRVPTGRLKKRETPGEETEYIQYERANRSSPKASEFVILSEERAKERFGAMPLPVWVVVKKKRELWLHRNVRIHLDHVEGLGAFVEFEAQVGRDHDEAACHAAVAELREIFGPALGEAIDRSYSDLIAAEEEERERAGRDEGGAKAG